MPAGLFGKLPAKRDFIATMAPRRFLNAWEPWLQTSLAASRYALAAGWGDYYNRAPMWRFWLGPALSGETTVGVLMASVDGVGRAFPLTLFSTGNERPPPPPEIEANDAWFEAAEALLLTALEFGVAFEQLAAPRPRCRRRYCTRRMSRPRASRNSPIGPLSRASEIRASARRSSDPASSAARVTILSASGGRPAARGFSRSLSPRWAFPARIGLQTC